MAVGQISIANDTNQLVHNPDVDILGLIPWSNSSLHSRIFLIGNQIRVGTACRTDNTRLCYTKFIFGSHTKAYVCRSSFTVIIYPCIGKGVIGVFNYLVNRFVRSVGPCSDWGIGAGNKMKDNRNSKSLPSASIIVVFGSGFRSLFFDVIGHPLVHLF